MSKNREEQRDARAGTLLRRIDWRRISMLGVVVPVVLGALYFVVQWMYLRPVAPSDQIHYMEIADAFPDLRANHRALRIGLTLPVKFFQWLFGYSEAAYYALPFLGGALLIVGTYLLGRRLFDVSVGLGAALLLLFSGLFLEESSHLLPDHLSAAIFMGGVLLLLAGVSRDEGTADQDDRAATARRTQALLIGAGLMFGWAYLVREYIPLLFPLVPYLFWRYRVAWSRLLYVAIPAFVLFMGELALNAALYSRPFIRLYEGGTQGGFHEDPTTRSDVLFRLPDTLAASPGGRAFVVVLVLFGFTLFVRQRSFRIAVVWFLLLWVPLTLGTGLIDPQFRFIRAQKLRYWMPVMPIVIIGALAVVYWASRWAVRRFDVGDFVRRWAPRAVVLLVAGLLAVNSFEGVATRGVFRVNGADDQWVLRGWLADEGQDVDVIWADARTERLLPVYSRTTFGDLIWSGEVQQFLTRGKEGEFVEPGVIDSGAVVLYGPSLKHLPDGFESVPAYIREPQPGWQVEIDEPGLKIYRVGPPAD